MPYLRTLSSFRDGVRKVAIAANGQADSGVPTQALKDILALCDKLRDTDLVPLGVALDDLEGTSSQLKSAVAPVIGVTHQIELIY